MRSNGGWKLASVAPAIGRPEKPPLATAITRNLDKRRCTNCGNNISAGMRKSTQKCAGLTGILLIVALAFSRFYVSLGGDRSSEARYIRG